MDSEDTAKASIRPKVFGIGMYRTGTTSLGIALERLGFRATYKFWNQFPRLAPYFDLDTRKFEPLAPEIRAEADRFDAFSDAPWLYLYRELDEWYPGSRFILTIRSSSEAIVKSEYAHWERAFIMERWLAQEGYRPSPEHFVQRYEQHNENVRAYFRDRPDDLLEICFETEPKPWQRLCAFIGVDAVPDEPFPHANRSPATEAPISAPSPS
jgi:hypothetical protein